MRFWFQSYVVRATLVGAAIVSLVTHAVLITAWVFGTLPTPEMAPTSIANHVFYIPPPDRSPTAPGGQTSGKALKYVGGGAGAGVGTGEGAHTAGEAKPKVADQTVGHEATDSALATPAPVIHEDSVYSVLDVDTAVVRSASSAAPAYPLNLLQQHIQGYVNARYVVDTTGFADTTTFIVVEATNPGFITAVRAALPYMRFQPAKIGPDKVRQLVEQQFTFRIMDPDSVRRAPAQNGATRKPPA